MKTIYKYPLKGGYNFITLNKGFKVLSVQNQNNVIVLYCLVDTDEETVACIFDVYPTGGEVTPDVDASKFIGSVMLFQGYDVWHVFQGGTIEY